MNDEMKEITDALADLAHQQEVAIEWFRRPMFSPDELAEMQTFACNGMLGGDECPECGGRLFLFLGNNSFTSVVKMQCIGNVMNETPVPCGFSKDITDYSHA